MIIKPDMPLLKISKPACVNIQLWILAGSLLIAPSFANGDEFVQGVSASLGLEYDSNPLMKASGEKSLWRTLISPKYNLLTSSGPNEYSLNAGLDVQRSTDSDILVDRADPNLDLQWKRFLETGEFSFKTHYDKASTRYTELENSGLVNKDGTRTTKSVTANWLYNLDEKYSITSNAGFSAVDYDSGNLSNYKTKNLSANLTRLNSETFQTYVQIAYTHFQLDTGSEPSKQLNSGLGMKWDITEQLALGANLGVNKISGASSGSGNSGGANISYQTEKSRTLLDISRSTTPSGIGGFIESDKLKLAWSYALSDIRRAGLDYTLSKNHSFNDSETRYATIWISQELSGFWSLKFSVQHKESILSASNSQADVIGFTFQYSNPNF